MHALVIQAEIVLALCLVAGCTGFSGPTSIPTSHRLPQTAPVGESADGGFQWREEAQELRTFADHHDVEAELLLQGQSPADARSIQQRRALARQLRVAAAQMEQGGEEVESRGGPRLVE
jgi:hypothetical protein